MHKISHLAPTIKDYFRICQQQVHDSAEHIKEAAYTTFCELLDNIETVYNRNDTMLTEAKKNIAKLEAEILRNSILKNTIDQKKSSSSANTSNLQTDAELAEKNMEIPMNSVFLASAVRNLNLQLLGLEFNDLFNMPMPENQNSLEFQMERIKDNAKIDQFDELLKLRSDPKFAPLFDQQPQPSLIYSPSLSSNSTDSPDISSNSEDNTKSIPMDDLCVNPKGENNKTTLTKKRKAASDPQDKIISISNKKRVNSLLA